MRVRTGCESTQNNHFTYTVEEAEKNTADTSKTPPLNSSSLEVFGNCIGQGNQAKATVAGHTSPLKTLHIRRGGRRHHCNFAAMSDRRLDSIYASVQAPGATHAAGRLLLSKSSSSTTTTTLSEFFSFNSLRGLLGVKLAEADAHEVSKVGGLRQPCCNMPCV